MQNITHRPKSIYDRAGRKHCAKGVVLSNDWEERHLSGEVPEAEILSNFYIYNISIVHKSNSACPSQVRINIALVKGE